MSSPEPTGATVITLFTIAGTGHPGAAGARSTGRGCFPQQVAQRVDPTKYRWSPIPYAAALPFTRSVAGGITKLTDAINSTDGEFAIAAYSQGVMVAAPVYRSLRNGPLKHRKSDLRAVVAFANPAREAGHTFPGCPDPDGHGIMSAHNRLTDTEDLWWDFAIPNDLTSAVSDDLAGRWHLHGILQSIHRWCARHSGHASGSAGESFAARDKPGALLLRRRQHQRRSTRPIRHLQTASGESEDLCRSRRGIPRQHRSLISRAGHCIRLLAPLRECTNRNRFTARRFRSRPQSWLTVDVESVTVTVMLCATANRCRVIGVGPRFRPR